MHAAAFNDHVECMQLLLKRAAAADVADNRGMTPLMMAAKHGHANVVGMPNTRIHTNTHTHTHTHIHSHTHARTLRPAND